MNEPVPLETPRAAPYAALLAGLPALPAPSEAPPPSAGLSDVLGALRRHWLLVALVSGTVVASAVVVTAFLPRTYEATATIRIDPSSRTLPALDAMRGLDQASDVSAEMTELGSFSLAEEVADSLALRVSLAAVSGAPRGFARGDLLSDVRAPRGEDSAAYRLTRRPDGSFAITSRSGGEPLAVRRPGERVTLGDVSFTIAPRASPVTSADVLVVPSRDAIDAMRRRLRIARPMRESNIVTITYSAHDRRLARDVPNAVAALFIERRSGARQSETRRTASFLREQIDRLSSQLVRAEDSLRDFRESARVTDIGEQARAGVNNLAQLEVQRSAADAERVALARLLDEASASARSRRADDPGPSPYRTLVAFPTLLRNEASSQLLASLSAAEDRRAELLTRRTPQDPDVQQVDVRVRELEEQLRSITATYLQGLSNQVSALDGELASARERLAGYPKTEVRLGRLERRTQGLGGILGLLQTRLKEAEIAESAGDGTVRVTDLAVLPRRPSSPSPVVNLFLATIAGLALGGGAALVRERADRSIRSRNQLQSVTGATVLGFIPRAGERPRIGSAEERLRAVVRSTRHPGAPPVGARVPVDPWPVAESYQRLATNIAFARADGTVKVLLVTSPLPGDGKTTVSVNLALTLARAGRRVLLVDADVRRAMIHTLLPVPRAPGLGELLREEYPLPSVTCAVPVDGAGTLDVIPAGAPGGEPASTLTAKAVRQAFERLEAAYDFVVVDSSPINVVADAVLLARHAGAVIVVARAGVTTAPDLAFAMEQLRQVDAQVLGTVLNDIDLERDASYDGAYRYYRSYAAYSTVNTA